MFYNSNTVNQSLRVRRFYKFVCLFFLLSLGACGGDDSSSSAMVTLPTLSVSNASVKEGDSGSADLVFSVRLDTSASDVVSVDFIANANNITTIPGEDFAATNGTLTINPGMTSAEIAVSVFGDIDVESDETITLMLSNPSGIRLSTATATGTILNDDQILLPVLTINNASISEGDSGTSVMSFTVNLNSASTSNVTVEYATVDVLANAQPIGASDYVAVFDVLTITAGNTSATIDVTINGDTINESDETFMLTLSNPVGITLANNTVTGTILNDDGPTAVVIASIADSSVSEGNSGITALEFTVSLSSAPQAQVSIDYATSDGTAYRFGDYTSVTGTLIIPAGQTTGTISIDVVTDTNPERDETFMLTLSNPSNNATLGISVATGTIENDDLQTITVVDTQISEGDSGNSAITFYFNAGYTRTAIGPMSFNYTTIKGTALPGEDYTTTRGTISFNTGEWIWGVVTVNILGDIDIETDETFTLQLSNIVGINLSSSLVTATIINDDADISISNARVTEGDAVSSNLTYRVNLDQPVAGDVSVDYTTGLGTATAGVDYTAVSAVLIIPAGETQGTITVSVNGDTSVEQNEIIPVILSNVSNNVMLGRSVAFGIIDNDDGGLLSISLPKTGQQDCFDVNGISLACSGTGQDGELQKGVAFPMPRFIDNNNDGTITDDLTGLIWPAQGNIMLTRDSSYDTEGIAGDGQIVWQTALNYIAKLNQESYLGFNDWRLPNRNELRSLANYGVTNNLDELNKYGFSGYGGIAPAFWSSSSVPAMNGISTLAWGVNLVEGYVFAKNKKEGVTAFLNVVPVRGGHNSAVAVVLQTGQDQCYDTKGVPVSCSGTGQDGEYQLGAPFPNARFTATNTTITDTFTGLIWVTNANIMADRDPGFDTFSKNGDGKVNWQMALDYIAQLNTNSYLGFNDWRLPNINEYESLLNIEAPITGLATPIDRLNTIGFNNMGENYWTSNSYYPLPTKRLASLVHFGSALFPVAGSNPAVDKNTGANYVWPVRGM